MIVGMASQLLARARPAQDSDDQPATGVPAFEQVRRSVAGLGDSAGVADSKAPHQLAYHEGMRATLLHLVACDRCIDGGVRLPPQAVDQNLRNVATEARVERYLDAPRSEPLKRRAGSGYLADGGVGAVE